MITTDASTRDRDDAAALLDPPPADRRLRFAADPSRSAPIGDQPITVGAGPRSDVRIDAAGVKPLVCVISRRGADVFVRRWSNDVRLNDAEFTEAAIHPGDRLSVGPVELELYSDEVVDEADDAAEPDEDPQATDERATDEFADTESAPEAEAPTDESFDEPVNEYDASPVDEPEFADQPAELEAEFEAEVAVEAPAEEPAAEADEFVASESDEEPRVEDDLWSAVEPSPEAEPETEPETPAELFHEESFQDVGEWTTPDEEAIADEPSAPQDLWDIERDPAPLASESPAEPAEPVAEETFDSPAAELSDEVSAWAESLEAPPEAPEAQPWDAEEEPAEEPVAEVAVEPQADFDAEPEVQADLSFDAEPEVEADPVADAEPEVVAAEPADADRLRRRLSSNKDRVRRLVAWFRESQADSERQATAAADAIELLRSQLSSTEQRCAELIAGNEELREELVTAVSRIEALETQPETVEETFDAPAAIEDSVVAEEATGDSFVAPEPADFAEEAAEVAPAETDEPLWGIEAAQESVASPAEPEPVEESVEQDDEPAGFAEPVADETVADEPAFAPELLEQEPIVESPEVAEVVSDGFEEQAETVEESYAEASAPGVDAPSDESLWAAEATSTEEEPEADPEPATTGETGSFYERYAHLLPADDEEEAVATPPPAAPAPAFEEPSADFAGDEDDGSIDDYLKQMMARIRGDNESAPAEPTAPAAVEPTPAPKAEEAPAAPVAAVEEPTEPLVDLEDLRTRQAPEMNADMGTLRQLANQSARDALHTAHANQTKDQALRQFIIAVFAVGCGVLASVTAPTLLGWRMLVGIVGVLVGGYLSLQTLRDLKSAIRREAEEQQEGAPAS